MFGKDIRQLAITGNKSWLQKTTRHNIAEPESVTEDMLRLLETNRIKRQINGRLTVKHERCRLGTAMLEILKHVTEVDDFTPSNRRGHVFSLGGRKRNTMLATRPPNDGTAVKENDTTTDTVTCLPRRIGVHR